VGGIGSSAISSTASNVGIGYATLTVTPSPTEYVVDDSEYYILITATAANNLLGNISVNVYN
jgi:hypothetical protein